MRHNTTLVIPAIAILLFSFGVIFEPQNAYAGNGNGEPEPEIDHGQVVEIHCDVDYEWILFNGDGEREGDGLCTYTFEDEFELEEVDVEIFGEFEIDFIGIEFPIVGTFHIEDEFGNGIWIDEEGTIVLFCDEQGRNGEGLPYCLDTVGTVVATGNGDGIFTGLTGTSMREASGFIFFGDFIEGFADGTVWVFFDLEEEETPTGKGGGTVGHFVNNQQPSIGVTEKGTRVVDGGITVNGKTVDAEFYFTPFPLIQSDIGQPIDFVFKIWDDRKDNIRHLQLQLGKGKVGESFTIDHSATYNRDKMTGEVTVTHDPIFTNVIMEQLPDQPCKTGSNECTVIHVRVTPTEAIVGNVVFGVNIWDEAGNANTSFFNKGLQVGTESDVIAEEEIDRIVIKKQLRTDDGWGNIDKRYSEAFAMKLAWHNEQVQKKAIELGYIF